jgi:hypothetical protein
MIKRDQFGQACATESDVSMLLYKDPRTDLSNWQLTDPDRYNASCDQYFLDWPRLATYQQLDISIEEFDHAAQSRWRMPQEYQDLDIAKWVLDQCQGQAELQRCGQELMMYQDRDAFDLLRYLKYLVDTMRANQIVWGVGRGSSVASFVLYLIGIHRINSLAYDLDPAEFLK